MITCPCCGSSSETEFDKCAKCGAEPVGPPLVAPVEALPSFGLAAAACAGSALALATLLVATVGAVSEQKAILTANFGEWLTGAEIAAWRLKYVLLPATLGSIWMSWRAYARARREPRRWAGRRLGLGALGVASVSLIFAATLIGVTVPARLEKRELVRALERQVPLSSFHRMVTQYRVRYGTLPADVSDLRKLPDPDRSIEALLAQIPAGAYSASAEKASLRPPIRSRKLRGGVRLQPIALGRGKSVDDLDGETISFTNYVLRLPGEDNLPNTSDDVILRDGLSEQFAPAADDADAIEPSASTGAAVRRRSGGNSNSPR